MTSNPLDASHLGLRPLRWQIAALTALSALIAVTDSIAIAGIAGLFAGSLASTDPTLTAGLGAMEWIANWWVVLAAVLVTLVLNGANAAFREYVAADWEAQRRLDLVRAFREATFEAQSSFSGSALSVTAEQIGQAVQIIGGITGLINTILRAAVYLAVSFVVSPAISGLAVGVGLLLVVVLRGLTRRTRAMHRRISRDRTDIGEQIGDMTTSSRELHLLSRWDDVMAKLEGRILQVKRDRFRSASLATMVGPIYWAGTLLVGLILVAATSRMSAGVGGLAASGLLLIRALNAAQAAQVMYQTYNDSIPYVEAVTNQIGVLRAARRATGDEAPGERPSLKAEGISVSYGNDVIVRELDLEVSGTGAVAIVGPSGSGKSTTLLALSGFLTPSSGTVSVDGIPLDLLPSDLLGRTIGMLPQDPRLFRASLRDNLTRPDTPIDDAGLVAGLRRLSLDATVDGFAAGLDADMGRGGEGLSGGELQRLGLLRLDVNRPDIWLLDEPTSALDRANSDRVAELVAEAATRHLVVVVTHRPDLLEICSRLVYMEDGRVVGYGSVEEVAARHPFVAAMLEVPVGSDGTDDETAPDRRTTDA